VGSQRVGQIKIKASRDWRGMCALVPISNHSKVANLRKRGDVPDCVINPSTDCLGGPNSIGRTRSLYADRGLKENKKKRKIAGAEPPNVGGLCLCASRVRRGDYFMGRVSGNSLKGGEERAGKRKKKVAR